MFKTTVTMLISFLCLSFVLAQDTPVEAKRKALIDTYKLNKDFLPYDPENNDYCEGWMDSMGAPSQGCIDQCKVALAYSTANGCKTSSTKSDREGGGERDYAIDDCAKREANNHLIAVAKACTSQPDSGLERKGSN